MQYLISLVSKRAIISDINDIKECHKNLTEGRLPTILFYIGYLRNKEASKSLRPFWNERKGRASEKKEGGKERACVAPTP